MADAYLPVTVHHVPVEQVFDVQGRLLPNIQHYAQMGVVRVIAGALACHLVIDVKRPYYRPASVIEGPVVDHLEVV